MCRQAAFPPGFPRQAAIKILSYFAKGNGDGTGYAYVEDGKFITKKWPFSLARVLARHEFLDHMPYDGWTIAHLRAATHGNNTVSNTHPFVKGKWCVAHNGIWSEHEIVRAALKGHVEWEGETDSEVAAQLLSTVGPKRFTKLVDFGGVYLALHQNGELWVAKTSGDLQSIKTKYGLLLASELPENLEPDDEPDGWMRLDTIGDLIDQKEVSFKWSKYDDEKPDFPKGPVGLVSHAFHPPGMTATDEEEKKQKFGYVW